MATVNGKKSEKGRIDKPLQYVIIKTQEKERKIAMFTLKYNDLVSCDTFTFRVFDKQQREIELLEAKLKRMKDFDIALTNYLQTHGEMSLDLYDKACVLFDHSDKTVPEIFEEIRKEG